MNDGVDETVAVRVEHEVVVLHITLHGLVDLGLQILGHQVQRLEEIASVVALHLADAGKMVVVGMVAVEAADTHQHNSRSNHPLLRLPALLSTRIEIEYLLCRFGSSRFGSLGGLGSRGLTGRLLHTLRLGSGLGGRSLGSIHGIGNRRFRIRLHLRGEETLRMK